MDKFVIIDGNNLVFRAFYALPPMTNFDGEPSNAVFGFTNMLVRIIKEVSPKYMAVTFDVSKKTFRHEKFPDYKGTRKPAPIELINQIPAVKNLLKAMNITVVEREGLEADDLMGCLSRKFESTHNIIVSADRDAYQLINKNTEILFPKKGISETVFINEDNLKDYYGVDPSKVVDLKSLMGDVGDNIPGVSGVGEKKALQLINEYGSLDGVYENIDKITGKLKENLINDKEKAYLSQYLATILTDEKLDYVLEDFEYDFPFSQEVKGIFKRYQFASLLKKEDLYDNEVSNVGVQVDQHIVDNIDKLQELYNAIDHNKEMYFYLDENKFHIFSGECYAINTNNDLLSSGLGFDIVLDKLKPLLEDKNITKIVYDYKLLKHTLDKYDISLGGVCFDCVIARYLINPLARMVNNLEEIFNENAIAVDNYAYGLTIIKDVYYSKLEKMDLLSVFYDIEMPLVEVLYNMEVDGFKVDTNEIKLLEDKYRQEIVDIEGKIFEMVGDKFNLSSPKQLGEILFDRLGLNISSNKKKSTSIEILNEIVDKHPIVPLIIRWRTITKLYSTYIIGFENLLDANGKIHTVFNQTMTSTGRLSSSEPNLQNIPIRTEEGRGIRKMFVPSHNDGLIVSADYSQIELRLLASFSQDENLINAFLSGQDIHSRTASEVFGIPIENVDDAKRREAKAINFGIVYGISDYGLSQNIGVSRKDAGNYIKLYFQRYPKVEEFIKKNVELAYKEGCVKTLFGRIRPVPEVLNNNHNIRTFGERVAMNMPLQGSASDIIKLAMVRVFNELQTRRLKSRIIVQVHDELVVDVYPGELHDVEEILKTGMEGVVNLSVPLVVNIASGPTWYEAK